MTSLLDLPEDIKIVSEEEGARLQQIRVLEFFKDIVMSSNVTSIHKLLIDIDKKIKELESNEDNNNN